MALLWHDRCGWLRVARARLNRTVATAEAALGSASALLRDAKHVALEDFSNTLRQVCTLACLGTCPRDHPPAEQVYARPEYAEAVKAGKCSGTLRTQ